MAVPAIIECCNAIYTQIIGGDQGDGDEKEEIEPGQEHVFAFYDELTEEEREELDEDYDAIDVDKMESAFLAAMDHLDRSEDMHMCVAPHTLNFRLKKAPVAQPGANLASSYNTPEKIVKVWRNLGLDLFFQKQGCHCDSQWRHGLTSWRRNPKGGLGHRLTLHEVYISVIL